MTTSAVTTESETPDEHGFVLTGDDVVHGHHLPMFHEPQHQYQVVARFEVSEHVRALIKEDFRTHPTSAYALVNNDNMLLEQIRSGQTTKFSAYLSRITPPEDPGPAVFTTIGWSFRARILQVLHYRKFDNAEYRDRLTYLLYGNGKAAALAHRATKAADFDQVVELSRLPVGIDPRDLEKSALEVRIPGLPERTITGGHYTENPLRASSCDAEVKVGDDWQKATLDIKASRWFDTTFINMHHASAYHSRTEAALFG